MIACHYEALLITVWLHVENLHPMDLHLSCFPGNFSTDKRICDNVNSVTCKTVDTSSCQVRYTVDPDEDNLTIDVVCQSQLCCVVLGGWRSSRGF